MAIIYKIYNDINNKVYIGQTIRPLNKRWEQHKKVANNIECKGHLQLAIRKYGINNFHIEEIEQCEDNIRFEREKYWIRYYDSYNNGYNSTLGGEDGKNYDYDYIYELWLKGLSTKEIQQEVECCKETIQTALKSKGITYKDYMNRTFAKPVIQYSKNGEYIARYNSANEAGRAMGKINGSNIIKCCKGEIKTSLGYIWKYENDDTPIEKIVKNKKKNTTGKRVQQYNLDGILLMEYESCEQAGKAIGKSGSGINRCARGERRTAYGYIWKYKT